MTGGTVKIYLLAFFFSPSSPIGCPRRPIEISRESSYTSRAGGTVHRSKVTNTPPKKRTDLFVSQRYRLTLTRSQSFFGGITPHFLSRSVHIITRGGGGGETLLGIYLPPPRAYVPRHPRNSSLLDIYMAEIFILPICPPPPPPPPPPHLSVVPPLP